MTAHKFRRVIIGMSISVVMAAVTFAQDDPHPGVQPAPMAGGEQHDMRFNVLRQLGLSEDQIRSIRRINMERRPAMQEAQSRFREANRALDEAIYADKVDDAVIEARIKDVHTAQAEVSRIRFMSELAIRRVLTAEQLVRFRELRARFEQMRHNWDRRRKQPMEDRPFRRSGGDAKVPHPSAATGPAKTN